MPAGLAKLHSVCPERFSRKNSFFVGKLSCKPFSDCRRQMIGRMGKNVKPVCQTCNLRVQMIVLMKKTFYAGITVYFLELRKKISEASDKTFSAGLSNCIPRAERIIFLKKTFLTKNAALESVPDF